MILPGKTMPGTEDGPAALTAKRACPAVIPWAVRPIPLDVPGEVFHDHEIVA